MQLTNVCQVKACKHDSLLTFENCKCNVGQSILMIPMNWKHGKNFFGDSRFLFPSINIKLVDTLNAGSPIMLILFNLICGFPKETCIIYLFNMYSFP